MKLLYRVISRADAEMMLEDVGSDVQEVNLLAEAVAVIMEALAGTNRLLPLAQRCYREWSVGMLRRWEG